MQAELEFELEFVKNRVHELQQSLDMLREQRDNLSDTANSLMREVDALRTENKLMQSVIDRLRLHIQQGVEL